MLAWIGGLLNVKDERTWWRPEERQPSAGGPSAPHVVATSMSGMAATRATLATVSNILVHLVPLHHP